MPAFVLALGCLAAPLGALSATPLPIMLQVDWTRLPDIPAQGPAHQGFQDSDGGWIDDDTVVTSFGYSSGGVPGFLNTSFLLNVTAATAAARRPSALLESPLTAKTGCSYEFPGGKCPTAEPTVHCKTDTDCELSVCPGGCTCRGVKATCQGSGLCGTPAGATLCSSGGSPPTPPSPPPPPAPPTPPTPWKTLPSAPISGRQEVGATLVEDGTAIVYIGGFSYAPIDGAYSFSDVVKLTFGRRLGSNTAPVRHLFHLIHIV